MSKINNLTVTLGRFTGLFLVFCGVSGLLLALVKLWLLYQAPEGIMALTQAIDAAGGLDRSLLGEALQDGQRPMPVAYFLAWTLAIVLLATIGRVAYWAIRAGASLVALAAPAEPSVKATPVQSQVDDLPEDYQPSHRQKTADMPRMVAPNRRKPTR